MHHALAADPDGVDAHALLGRQIGRLERIDRARGIGPVGQQDQHPVLLRLVAQPLHRQADRVADRGLLTRQTDLCLVEQGGHGLPVQGQRRLQIGLAAEQDQTDPVTRRAAAGTRSPATLTAVTRLTAWPPSRMSSLIMEPEMSTASIRLRPVTGSCTDSPSSCGLRRGHHQQNPGDDRQQTPPGGRARRRLQQARALQHRQERARAVPPREVAGARRQQPQTQQRQRQQQEQPGPGEVEAHR